MKQGIRLFTCLSLFALLSAAMLSAQDPPPGPQQQGQERGPGGREGGRPTAFGRITAIHDGSLEVTNPEGQVITVKLTPQTDFRKDRETAKLSDFKVGDMVMIRGTLNADNTVTANMIGGRSGGAMGGPGGRQGGGMIMNPGTLGKDYVAGEVKSIDPPKITVLRSDGVTQTLELNENTSLRRGRDSITMADIKVGDHVMARGGVQNDLFVPNGVIVLGPEPWQRMQERMSQQGAAAGGAAAPDAAPPAPPAKPQE